MNNIRAKTNRQRNGNSIYSELKNYIPRPQLFMLLLIIGTVFTATTIAQKDVSIDDPLEINRRPFDFSDSYFRENGIKPSLIVNQVSGTNEFSVFSQINLTPSIYKLRQTGTILNEKVKGMIQFYENFGCDYIGANYVDNNSQNVFCLILYIGENENIKE